MAMKTFFGSIATLCSSIAALVLHIITSNDHKGAEPVLNGQDSEDTMIGSSYEPEIRKASIVKVPNSFNFVCQPSRVYLTPKTTFVGPRLGQTVVCDSFDSSLGSSVFSSIVAQRKGNKSLPFSKGSRHCSVTTDVEFNFTEVESQINNPQRGSLPMHIRPIAESAEYDWEKMNFITTPNIAEDEASCIPHVRLSENKQPPS
ncbi:hypothetical protein TWF696_001643 [Orbilia brochopaga]|uniref:Uncharacterized protein n=1 Tax=Orbilia brochopaga TaxID=3140254 RepID=A0AAV9U8E6_9PEZI